MPQSPVMRLRKAAVAHSSRSCDDLPIAITLLRGSHGGNERFDANEVTRSSPYRALSALQAAEPQLAAPAAPGPEPAPVPARVLPPWLRGLLVGPAAVLCACFVVLVPFLGFTTVGAFIWSAAAGGSEGDKAPATAGGSVDVRRVADAVDALRQDLRSHVDEDRREVSGASSAAVAAHVRRLEQTVAAATAASAATAARAPAAAGGAGDVAGLGFDWAAWSAGAEIDAGHTSAGIGRGLVGRTARALATLLPHHRARVAWVSHPAEVVLAADSAPPSRCFTFQGNGTLAVRLARGVLPTHVVVEQPPAVATERPRAAPRHVEVRVWPVEEDDASSALPGPYGTRAGAFEYALLGPRAQVFALDAGLPLARAVQFVFGGSWGEDHTSVCRLRVLGPWP